MLEAQRAQNGGGYGGGRGGRGGRDYGMRGRPGPYDRMGGDRGPPLGRGFGASGPRGGGRMKSKSLNLFQHNIF